MIVFAFSITVNGWKLLLTQYLLHVYSDFFLLKKRKIAREFCELAQSAFGNVLSTGAAEVSLQLLRAGTSESWN